MAGSRTASRTFTQQRVFFNRMVKNTKITLTSQHVLFSGAAVQHGGGHGIHSQDSCVFLAAEKTELEAFIVLYSTRSRPTTGLQGHGGVFVI